MAHRHKKHKGEGGGVAPKHDAHKKAYNAQGSNVEKEAEEEKRGGKVKHKATGGAINQKAAGGAVKPRLDKRARGGGIHHGSGKDMTKSPFSAAHISGHAGAATNPHPHKGHHSK
jgi:hypothetical protein